LMHRMQLAWKRVQEAISKFVEGLEAQERSGFDDTHRLLKGLPVPVTKAIRVMTHAQAIEAQFLPNMTDEEKKRFTPSELFLY
jgi:chemotaxis methyl-accepting protein methylase